MSGVMRNFRSDRLIVLITICLLVPGILLNRSDSLKFRLDLAYRGIFAYEAKRPTDDMKLPDHYPGGLAARWVIFQRGNYRGYISKWGIFEDIRTVNSAVTSQDLITSIRHFTWIIRISYALITIGIFTSGYLTGRRWPFLFVGHNSGSMTVL